MDASLTGERIAEEKAYTKRYIENLAARKVEYPDDYTPPLETRPRKIPVLHTHIIPPPDVEAESSKSGELNEVTELISDASVKLTVKSLKPALTLSVDAKLSESVADLKQAVTAAGGPPAEAQRLLLKGKALADTKLLMEYELTDGAVINLIAKAAPPPAAAAPAPSQVPTTPVTRKGGDKAAPPPSLTITTDAPGAEATDMRYDLTPEPPSPVSGASFHSTLSSPSFWQKIHALCQEEFMNEAEADTVVDTFLVAVKSRISANEAALIRDTIGVAGMGGGV